MNPHLHLAVGSSLLSGSFSVGHSLFWVNAALAAMSANRTQAGILPQVNKPHRVTLDISVRGGQRVTLEPGRVIQWIES